MELIPASSAHIVAIYNIACKTWPSAYGDILSQEQIDYMLDMMYREKILREQMGMQDFYFYIIRDKIEDMYQAFISFQVDYEEEKTKIHKIYILPQCQKKGLGEMLINKAEEIAIFNKNRYLQLNVNKNNKAVGFYNKVGFNVAKELILDIGNGYVMDDYIMEKEIQKSK